MRNTLRSLTSVRGVLAAGVFDERGTRLAVCGHAPALAALTYADAHPSFASGVEPDDEAVVEHSEFAGGRVVTIALEVGVLEVVVDVCTENVDPDVARHIEAAATALCGLIDALDLDDVGFQAPNSETLPCFVRPPGY